MITKIVDRTSGKIYEEECSSKALFLYNNKFGKIILNLVNKRFVSKLAGFYMNTHMSTMHIKGFIKANNIDMGDYEEKEFNSFNEFFSRKVKNGTRPFSKNKNDFIAPSDSKVLVYEINKSKSFKIKGKDYSLDEILKNPDLASEYKNGYLIVFRLSVDDYHRYIFVDDGKVLLTKKINGIFNTVGPIAFKNHKVFSENQREYQLIKTSNFGKIIQMEVGALLVGKIKNNMKESFKRGEEKGYFLFGGSTIIIILKENMVELATDILENSKKGYETKVKCGETIGKKLM